MLTKIKKRGKKEKKEKESSERIERRKKLYKINQSIALELSGFFWFLYPTGGGGAKEKGKKGGRRWKSAQPGKGRKKAKRIKNKEN